MPGNLVRSIYQDSDGFIWSGTYTGLSYFDGYEVTQLFDQDDKPLKDVRVIVEDQNGSLWFGSAILGLFKYEGGVLKPVSLNTANTENKPAVYQLLIQDETLYVGTSMGLYVLDMPSLTVQANFLPDQKIIDVEVTETGIWAVSPRHVYEFNAISGETAELSISAPTDGVYTDLFVNQGLIFLSKNDGLYQYSDECKCLSLLDEAFQGTHVKKIIQQGQKLWVGTIAKGVVSYNLKTHETEYLVKNPDDPYSFPGNHVFSLLDSRSGLVWFGTFENGLVYTSSNQLNFGWVHRLELPFHCALSDVVFDFLAIDEAIWVATDEGLVELGDETKDCRLYHPKNKTLSSESVNSLRYDGEYIWVAGSKGLDQFDGESKSFVNVLANHPKMNVNFSHPIQRGQLLIGTNLGLYFYDFHDDVLKPVTDQQGGNIEAVFYGFDINQSGFLLNSNQGLFRLLPTGTLEEVQFNQGLIAPLKQVTSLKATSDGIWFGANDEWVFQVNQTGDLINHTDKFQTDQHRLAISGIIEDDQGIVWLSASNGLWRYDPQTKLAHQFNRSDGLQSNTFKIGSAYQADNGELFFGGKGGFNRFDPALIEASKQIPEVVITQIAQLNEPLRIGDRTLGDFELQKPVNQIQSMALNHKDIDISFEFSALDYIGSQSHKYAYRLLGFNDQWSDTDSSHRVATYTNLKPGDYEFQVKAATKHSDWSTPKSVLIKMSPAPWLSPWAYALYAVILIGLMLLYIRHRTASSRRRAEELESTVEERTQELRTQKQLVESLLDHKNELFSNVTHEFKTPLALIKGPVEELLKEPDVYEHRDVLTMIRRNANRLLNMVGQILKLSEVEQKQPVVRKNHDVKPLMNMLYESFTPLAQHKNIEFILDNQADCTVYTTPDCLEVVVGNLLSNAFKYTTQGGRVVLKAWQDDERLKVSVEDTGSGIGENDLEIIFDRFTRLDKDQQIQGTGIGLSVVKEITQANGGRIQVQSALGEGSCFIVSMPTADDEAEVVKLSAMAEQLTQNVLEEINAAAHQDETSGQGLISVLVIDDNQDMREHMQSVLRKKFQCLVAERGSRGVQLAIQESPDIVICDVMMPEMDGYQVTRILRNDAKTSHIPIILLTALNTKESRIKGWRENIDMYLTKPFDAQELLANIGAILSVRRILQSKTQEGLLPGGDIQTLDLPEQDMKFVTKLKDVIGEHYHDPLFMKPRMASQMAVSERQLQRKVKALIDESPMEMLRHYRLEMAAKKLANGYQVALVSDECGFNSVSYFASCFKKKYNMTPKKYQMEHRKP